ncbi:hypothetical protein F4818DRAFT_452368 [Hypoxylon cercidicola]|nr:hypothetical protein F4818DRAFT_452368 [Hypoxylon cercidicola]
MDFNGVEPQVPPYPGHYDNLQRWQRRWNREWVTDAFIPGIRRAADSAERNWIYGGCKEKDKHGIEENKRNTEPSVAYMEYFIPGADKKGKRGFFRHALHRIVLLLRLEDLKVEYRDFKKWHQERQEARSKVIIEADMEDEGNAPGWKGKMTFTMDPKLYSQYRKSDTWFPFPTQDNIRWHWVNESGRGWGLHGRADSHWGPSEDRTCCLPFRCIHGVVRRNVKQTGRNASRCVCGLKADLADF